MKDTLSYIFDDETSVHNLQPVTALPNAVKTKAEEVVVPPQAHRESVKRSSSTLSMEARMKKIKKITSYKTEVKQEPKSESTPVNEIIEFRQNLN